MKLNVICIKLKKSKKMFGLLVGFFSFFKVKSPGFFKAIFQPSSVVIVFAGYVVLSGKCTGIVLVVNVC